LTDWKVDQRLDKEKLERKTKEDELERSKQAESWNTKKEEAKKIYDDFDEVINSDIPVSVAMAEVLTNSSIGAHLAYYLCQNEKEANKIFKMTPLETAKALGKIEHSLESSLKNEKIEPAKKLAPKPTTPIKGAGGVGNHKSPDDMTFEEYKVWRKQHKR